MFKPVDLYRQYQLAQEYVQKIDQEVFERNSELLRLRNENITISQLESNLEKIVEVSQVLQELRQEKEVNLQELYLLKADQSSLESNIFSLKSQLESYQQARKKCEREIQEQNDILVSPRPKDQVERRCIHGHLNCPNLPNDQITIVNSDAVAAYERKIAEAQQLKNILELQLEQIKQECYLLQISWEEKNCNLLEINVACENKIFNIEQLKQKIASLEATLIQVQRNYEQDRITESHIAAQIIIAEQALMDAEYQQKLACSALTSIQNQMMQSELEIARASGNPVDHERMLEQIARQQLAQEQNSSGNHLSPDILPGDSAYVAAYHVEPIGTFSAGSNTATTVVDPATKLDAIAKIAENLENRVLDRVAHVISGVMTPIDQIKGNIEDMTRFMGEMDNIGEVVLSQLKR